MLNRIFRRLFSRKWELLILGVVVILCSVISKMAAVDHWECLNFDVTGYSVWAGPLGILWMGAYLLVLHLRHIRAISLWVMGFLGLGYSFLLLWMVNLQ